MIIIIIITYLVFSELASWIRRLVAASILIMLAGIDLVFRQLVLISREFGRDMVIIKKEGKIGLKNVCI